MRVVTDDGTENEVLNTREAIMRARTAGMDLIEVSPNADPPVCRVGDYGRLTYETAKRDKKGKTGRRTGELKEIRLRPHIGQSDLEAKLKKMNEFIGQGAKVKVTVRFRGRENAHPNLGLDLLRKIANELKDNVRLEAQPRAEGRSLSMTLIPARK